MGKTKNMMEERGVEKYIVNEFSKINIINNTTNIPHIMVNGDGIADSGNILHCCCRDTPTDNDLPVAKFHAGQPDGSKIVSTVKANMKLSTLNKEARCIFNIISSGRGGYRP